MPSLGEIKSTNPLADSRKNTRVVWRGLFHVVVLATALFFPADDSWARGAEPKMCETAARNAAQSTGVPLAVLRAITLAETGRKSNGTFQPWPWTVNMEGKGVWFDSRDAARSYADANFQRGARSFDVGCFQLNYKWHGQAFNSIEEMFDPTANAQYAAQFLRELYLEKGNWPDAAGAYHSRTPKFANKYKARFLRLLAEISPELARESGSFQLANVAPSEGPATAPLAVRVNNFPLLLRSTGTTASLGSLMPSSAGLGASRLFGGN